METPIVVVHLRHILQQGHQNTISDALPRIESIESFTLRIDEEIPVFQLEEEGNKEDMVDGEYFRDYSLSRLPYNIQYIVHSIELSDVTTEQLIRSQADHKYRTYVITRMKGDQENFLINKP